MNPRLPLDPRVWPGVVLTLILLFLGFWWDIPLSVPLLSVFLVAHLLFFRDPCRKTPLGQGLLSPADGKVVSVDEVLEKEFLNEPAVRVRIFLSVFDVHVTRAPLAGVVRSQRYVKGKFLNALRRSAFKKNESNWICIENHERRVLVRQLSGAIARRIYSDVKIGQVVGRGEKLGMICYGSGVEFYVAKRSFRVTVRPGQRVKAGLSFLGQWIDEG
ncbi:MAG: phosphatidylserine decarboxylase [Candidatus Omnitrophica bacterium]|nr:phosphatidylserine decarboxylase [Candidatus Omnitrophota bacterium]